MAKNKRPIIATYEPAGEPAKRQKLVHREMNDEEFELWQAQRDEGLANLEAQENHPLVDQVKGMSKKDKAALKKALG